MRIRLQAYWQYKNSYWPTVGMDIEFYWNPHSGAGLLPQIHVRSGIGYPEPSTEAEQKAIFCAKLINRASDRAEILRQILHTSDLRDDIPGGNERSQNDLSSPEPCPEPATGLTQSPTLRIVSLPTTSSSQPPQASHGTDDVLPRTMRIEQR